MASVPPVEPDPRTSADDEDVYTGDATGEGVSDPDAAEGDDDESAEQPGSPRG